MIFLNITGLQHNEIRTSLTPTNLTIRRLKTRSSGKTCERHILRAVNLQFYTSWGRNCNGYLHNFQNEPFLGCSNDVDLEEISKRKSEIQDGIFKNAVTQISALYEYDNDEILTNID